MVELNLTGAINRLIDGKATPSEQRLCGITLKNLIAKPRIKPTMSNGKPYCTNCSQPLNTKMKDGFHIHQFCKVCGQGVDWGDEK